MKLHLGCGTNYIPKWINIDFDSPTADLHLDLRNPLPYPNASVEFIFNEHFIEHINRDEALIFLKECKRVLKPRGVFRTSTPDLRWLAAQYFGGKLDEWSDVGWEPTSSCRLLNEGMRLWGHQFLYDEPELTAILSEAGFSHCTFVKHSESSHPELVGLECRPWHRELIVEAR